MPGLGLGVWPGLESDGSGRSGGSDVGDGVGRGPGPEVNGMKSGCGYPGTTDDGLGFMNLSVLRGG